MAHRPVELHFVLIPYIAPGHLLPMVDFARLLSRRNDVKVTIMTTPLNALRVQANVDRERTQFGSSISLQHFPFPNTESDLPEGCESLDTLPSKDLLSNFVKALNLLQKPVEELFEKLVPSATCVIHDKYLPFVADIAKKLQVLRITFDGTNCFSHLCNHCLYNNPEVYECVSNSEPLVIPGLPHKIVFKKSQLPEWFTINRGEESIAMREKRWKDEEEAYGVIVNSFEELEEEYLKEFKRVSGRKVWCIGPVSFSNKGDLDMATRGKPHSKEEQEREYSKWLDSWPARSVIYVCLGSLTNVVPEQLMEIGLGLEATKRPFIWVLRDSNKRDEMERLLKEDGLEERVKGRGLITRKWVPQLLILSHKAIGAFLTHCGWNSTLEGICSGLPLITFPVFSDQFYNEKVVVQLLEIGASVGVENAMHLGVDIKCGVQVNREKVKEAIETVMGEESGSIRKRANDCAEKAKEAMEEGGSSWLNMSLMIDDIRHVLMFNENTHQPSPNA